MHPAQPSTRYAQPGRRRGIVRTMMRVVHAVLRHLRDNLWRIAAG